MQKMLCIPTMNNKNKKHFADGSITLLLIMGTTITPIQSYASEEREKTVISSPQ